MAEYDPERIRQAVRDAVGSTPLYGHQRDIARYCVEHDQAALFCEQGTGKTRPILSAVPFKPDPYPILVVCPKTVMSVWAEEARRWAGMEAVLVQGAKKRKERLVKETRAPLYVVNYDALRGWNYAHREEVFPGSSRRRLVRGNEAAGWRRWRTAVVDESSKIKHARTKQSQACHALSGIPYRYILSGTPITHSPLDLFSQYRFLDPGVFGDSWFRFENRYAEIAQIPLAPGTSSRGFTHRREVRRYRNLDELHELAHGCAVVFKKADCLDLPPKTYQRREVELSRPQRQAYQALVDDYVAFLGNGQAVAAPNVLARLAKLQEICQGFLIMEDRSLAPRDTFPNPKLEALRELLEEVTPSEKAIVWYRFTEDGRQVARLCGDLGVEYARIAGDVALDDRAEAMRQFQEHAPVRVMICQIGTAAFGITLTAATCAIYYSMDFNADNRSQSEDRNHRIGTTGTCVYIDLVCKGTIDESIIRNLATKKEFGGDFDTARFQAMAKGAG